ncbi:4Fe-4S dicluster domain-containing protein [Desulforhabdus sp. TSK]|uniref:4Fe-4S dicluster domain-containing protein n=1 Tax=Desulforhabdus sp. TSK TaxID=2925014 RepID=UPI001FC86BDF|nr:4Fe-4S dicluster domain-containing protein [Desulforhabdus sp. TSK]
MGLAGTTALVGCSSESGRTLIPYIVPTDDIIPGQATWYATTCRECPAGCGILAKNRDGHVIKVEGNPLHPVNAGKLCSRGQASLHGLYNPDRFSGPHKMTASGEPVPISWDEGMAILTQGLDGILDRGKKDRIVVVSDLVSGTLKDFIAYWLGEMRSREHILYEPFAYEPLRRANAMVFGTEGIPSYRLDRADFLLSFGAGFLETWLSNVEYARQFAAFRTPHDQGKNRFLYVGPRMSLTAANADFWVQAAPGDEFLVAAGMLMVLTGEGLLPNISAEQKKSVASLVRGLTLEAVAAGTGVSEETLRRMALEFARAEHPLALAEGLSFSSPRATETAAAAGLLCALHPGSRETIDFQGLSELGQVDSTARMQELSQKMQDGKVEAVLLFQANPAYSLPPSWNFHKSLQKVPLVVSFSPAMDETTRSAHLILPAHSPLESWGDYSPRKGVTGIMQPVMGPVFDSRHPGDILLAAGRQLKGPERFPAESFYHILRNAWQLKGQELAPGVPPETFWQEAVKRGGVWDEVKGSKGESSGNPVRPSKFSFPLVELGNRNKKEFHFTGFPTVQYYDGRGANRPWLQEIPDPISQITWGGWVEMHPDTARSLDLAKGDLVVIRSPYGSIEAPVFPLPTVPPDTLAVPIGQGHSHYGRFATAEYGNPMGLLPSGIDPMCNGLLRPEFKVTVEKLGRRVPIAHVDGSLFQHDREMARSLTLEAYREGKASGAKPHLYLPLPEGYDPAQDFYPPHDHVDYRWGMVIDLDRCIGCGACVAACYAENNVAVVGRDQILKGREMSWLRIQRYFGPDADGIRFFPMPCMHCDNAPCESVCPVYAPHHSKEGLNNQVYNRCIGTRFCAQNCPYKVRRFNWFTFTRPEPLNWQLNPDVTVRQKGVMEKCSFCVQRIIEAKFHAKDQGRKVQDGEFTTACAQTCPADAIVFGNLMDPESRVSRLIQDHRAYQALEHLNTKPAVFYLKKLTQEPLKA